MTREEQIKEAARQRAEQYDHPSKWSDTYYGFIDGAKWADQHPQWISVEEELPEDKQMVLVYLPPDEICDHEYMCEALYNYDWHGWESDEPIDLDGLTHWMEIYPPRKEG